MRKFLSVLLALVMVLSLMVPTAFAAEENVKILYTNDVHTYINGELNYATLAAYKKTFGENVKYISLACFADFRRIACFKFVK